MSDPGAAKEVLVVLGKQTASRLPGQAVTPALLSQLPPGAVEGSARYLPNAETARTVWFDGEGTSCSPPAPRRSPPSSSRAGRRSRPPGRATRWRSCPDGLRGAGPQALPVTGDPGRGMRGRGQAPGRHLRGAAQRGIGAALDLGRPGPGHRADMVGQDPVDADGAGGALRRRAGTWGFILLGVCLLWATAGSSRDGRWAPG